MSADPQPAPSTRRPFDGSEPDVDENGDERATSGPTAADLRRLEGPTK